VIEMPHRSITRFFIPMIDVLTLLFCIYLLMPLAAGPDEEEAADRAETEQRLREMEAEVKAKRGKGEDITAAARAELERLRKERTDALSARLRLRVLEVDDDGLFIRDPDRVPIDSAEAARKIIARDKEAIGSRQDLYYVILAPRDRTSLKPTREQVASYREWFSGVALGFDKPGAGLGGKP
jgi:hypothetical protein